MHIDWVTTAAQVVNFLVLVLLLNRFLYGPIVGAMNQREKDIAQRYEDIQSKRAAAEQQEADYRARLRDLEDARGERLVALQAEIDEERAVLLEKARAEITRLTESWRAEVEREKAAYLKRARQHAATQSVMLTRKALQDLAGVGLELRMAEQLVERIQELQGNARDVLAHAHDRGVEVRSSHEIPEHLRERIATELKGAVGADLSVSFTVSPDLGCGITLLGQSFRLEWSIEAYLSEFEQALAEALQHPSADAHA